MERLRVPQKSLVLSVSSGIAALAIGVGGGVGVGVVELTGTSGHASGGVTTGDVNCNGEINSIDAALVLQRTAGFTGPLACEQAGDVNMDLIINAVDADLILQYSAGLIGEAPGKQVPDETATGTPEPTPTKDGCGEAAGIEEGATYVDVCATYAAQTATPPDS